MKKSRLTTSDLDEILDSDYFQNSTDTPVFWVLYPDGSTLEIYAADLDSGLVDMADFAGMPILERGARHGR